MPANCKYALMSNATVWSVSLFSESFEPFENLLNKDPELIFDILIHFSNETTGQYWELSK